MFGHGLVDPVDGLGTVNAPLIPEVLDSLAGFFVASGFDLRELYRTIALTRAYRLSSGADAPIPDGRKWFAQRSARRSRRNNSTTVSPLPPNDRRDDVREDPVALSRAGNSSREQFLETFRTLEGRPTEYHGGIPQALALLNGWLIETATGMSSSGLLTSLDAPFFSDDQRIQILFLATLSREPTAEELARVQEGLRPSGFTGSATRGTSRHAVGLAQLSRIYHQSLTSAGTERQAMPRFSRRSILNMIAAGTAGASASGWFPGICGRICRQLRQKAALHSVVG